MTFAASSPSPATPVSPAPEAPRDEGVARWLAAGAFVTAAIGAPGQFVLPDVLKSATAALFATLCLALLLWRRREGDVPLRLHLFVLVPLALAALSMVSTFWAPASTAMMEGLRWLLIAIVVWVSINVLGPGTFGWAARAIHWGTMVTAVLALVEFWFGVSWFPSTAAPGSNFGNRNLFAEYVAVALPFSLWLLTSRGDLQAVLLRGAGVGLIVLSVFCTGTRAAMATVIIELLAALVFVAIVRRRGGLAGWTRGALAAAVAAPLLVVSTLGWVPTSNAAIIKEHRESARGLNALARAGSRLILLAAPGHYTGTTSFGRRVSVWSAGRGMLAAHPILGVGGGAWNTVAPLYLPDDLDTEYIWMAHNEPLQLVAELGLLAWVALAAVLALLVQALRGALRDLREGRADQAWMRATAVLVVVGFGLVGSTGLPLHQAPPVLLLAMALGALLALGTHRTVAPQALRGGAWTAARWVAIALVAVAVVLTVQGLRSSYLVHRATGILLGIPKSPGLSPQEAQRYHAEATEQLRRGLDIFADHGVHLMQVANAYGALSDARNMLWISNVMLETRPYVAEVQCNLARAHADLSQFAESGALIDKLRKDRPRSPCLPLTRFVYEYKRGSFPEALTVGQEMMKDLTTLTEPEQRYIVDMTYRAAARVPNPDAAVAVLRVRAERFPEYKAGSWYLIGQTLAQRAPAGTVADDALQAYRQAMAAANDAERAALLARIPEPYKSKLP